MELEKQDDIRPIFKRAIIDSGRKQTWVAKQLFIDKATLNLILNGVITLTEANRKRLNDILGTSIGDKIEDDE